LQTKNYQAKVDLIFEMASSTIAEAAPPLGTIDAKMIVATSRDHCQQLKDMVSKEDPSSMLVVMASGNQTCTPNSPRSRPPVMDAGLLAVACSGSWEKLHSFLYGDPRPTSTRSSSRPTFIERSVRWCCGWWKKCQSSDDGTMGGSAVQQHSRDQEALVRESFLDGVTVEGDTFLHVMATNSVSVDEDFIQGSLGLVHRKAVQFLSRENNNGDTPLHCAARAAKSHMVSFILGLARGNNNAADNSNTVKALLQKQNSRRWTALHEAIRAGSNEIVTLLMTEDPELASVPNDATSPMYLAILLEHKIIAQTIHRESSGVLSYSGPNGQNALHAAVLRGEGTYSSSITSFSQFLYLAHFNLLFSANTFFC
jgi:hypothetical protein